MRSLPLLALLALLLFTVVVSTSTPPSSQSPPATSTLIEELVANGGRRRFNRRNYSALYLTDGTGGDIEKREGMNFWVVPRQDWGPQQDWTIVQINDHEVAIRSNRGDYIGHGRSDYAQQAEFPDEWEMLTPVKNSDGSWSFKSRWDKWLSGRTQHDPKRYYYVRALRYYVNFQPHNDAAGEHWWLEPLSKPTTNPLMDELLADGGRRKFKAYNEWYLTDDGFDSASDGSFKLDPKLHVTPEHMGTEQQWTIVPMKDNEVAIKGHSGSFIRHYNFNTADLARKAKAWEMLTPVKNEDGTWSFKSRWNRWLSGGGWAEGRIDFMPENKRCERWKLEPW